MSNDELINELRAEAKAVPGHFEGRAIMSGTVAETLIRILHRAAAALESAPTMRIEVDGWKLVPVEPTEEQYEAVSNCGLMWKENNSSNLYRLMVAAAPSPPTQGRD